MNIYKLTAFYETDLGRRVLASPEVRREWPFNLVLGEDRQTQVQGVIDCAFREGDSWIILDYKTDHIDSEEAFVQRHQEQLRWYARALETLTGIPVKEMYLYSIGKEKAYRV